MDIIDLIYYVLLGLIQGITEFLPISSSGHLQLIEHLGFSKSSGLFTTIILHFATALSILFVFRKKNQRNNFFSFRRKFELYIKNYFSLDSRGCYWFVF